MAEARGHFFEKSRFEQGFIKAHQNPLGEAQAVKGVKEIEGKLGPENPVLPVFSGRGNHRAGHQGKLVFPAKAKNYFLVLQKSQLLPKPADFHKKTFLHKKALVPKPEQAKIEPREPGIQAQKPVGGVELEPIAAEVQVLIYRLADVLTKILGGKGIRVKKIKNPSACLPCAEIHLGCPPSNRGKKNLCSGFLRQGRG